MTRATSRTTGRTAFADRGRSLSSGSERSLSASSCSAAAVDAMSDVGAGGSSRAGSSPAGVDSPPPSPPVSLRTYNTKVDGACAASSSPSDGDGISTTSIRRKLSSGAGSIDNAQRGAIRGRSLSFGSAASSSPPSASVEAAAAAAAAPPLVPLSIISTADQDKEPKEDGGCNQQHGINILAVDETNPSVQLDSMTNGKNETGCDSSVATSSSGNRSPTCNGSNPKLRRKCSTTAQRTVMIREAGVENNIRRLVEYFVVVSCIRRQTRKRRDKARDQPVGDGTGEHNMQQHDAVGCPPSPPPAVQCLVAATTPTSQTTLQKSTTACSSSPKVQQRMNFRRVHLPCGDGGDANDGDTIANDDEEESPTLRPPDLDSASDTEQMKSSPTGIGQKKVSGPLSPRSRRLFKGKVRSCAVAMEEGSAKLRLPVLDQVGSDASTFDDSDCDDGRFNDNRTSSPERRAKSGNGGLGGISPLPDLNESAAAAANRPPLHPTPSLKARWIRDGGASDNIRMPGHDDDASGVDDIGSTNEGTAAAAGSHHGGAELIFEPQVTSRYPLEDYPNNKLNETAVAQFCNPSSDFIELTTEYQMPRVHHFVLTNEKGRKIYGTSLTIYEEYEPPENEEDLLPEEREILNWYRSHAGTVQYADGDIDGDGDGVEVALHRNAGRATLYLPRMLCLLSTWPYLTAFREYLTQLYRLATTTDQMTAPLERYILNICKEVPAPPPGAFEVRIDILNSAIRFWAPPANQPIAYVALPFGTLFECLDLSNILFVWYSLTLERKVLLVSSQCSILTVCAEILCSLLFPMKWSHLYIPTIPRFLTPMLDAPMPYLCGVTRENMAYAVGDISDETIVVDLDQNVITTGPYTPELPPIPHRRRFKLEKALEQNVGDVFWHARGLRKEQLDKVRNSKKPNAKERLDGLLDDAEQAWQMRNKGFDEAFNLAYAPDSVRHLDDDQLNRSPSSEDGGTNQQSQYDAVQEAFLRFYVAALKGYRKFLAFGDRPTFHSESFVKVQREDFQPFLQEFTQTQMFDTFITKRLINPGEPDCIFFDQSIDEKKNRSKLKINKTETPFLQSTKSHKAMKTFYAVEPNIEGVELELGIDSVGPNSQTKLQSAGRYEYSTWPDTLKPALFGVARPIPKVINAEFDHQSDLVAKIRSNYNSNDGEEDRIWDLYAAESDPSPEVAVFTIFFLVYSAAVGRALESVEEKRKKLNLGLDVYAAPTPTKTPTPTPTPTAGPDSTKTKGEKASEVVEPDEKEAEETEQDSSSFVFCADDLCCGLSDIPGYKDILSRITTALKVDENEKSVAVVEAVVEEAKKASEDKVGTSPPPPLPPTKTKYDRFDQMALFSAELEEARATTIAELDLAFDILSMMGARLLYADPDVYKNLMMACGKCGDAERATELMEVVQEEGLVADSEMHACFVNAFAANRGHSPYLLHDDTTPRRHHRALRHQAPSAIPFLPTRSFSRNRSSEQMRKDFVDNVNLALTMSSGEGYKSDSLLSRGSSIDADGDNMETSDTSGVEISRSGSILSTGNQLQDSVAMKWRRSRNKSVPIVEADRLIVTDSVSTHIALGESLLNLLYPDIVIDTNSDSCPSCSKILSEDDITRGWVPCAFKEYTTGCPQCQHRFVPKFTVSCSSPSFLGSQGVATPLYCEFLSPWVLRKEIHNVLRYGDGIDVMLEPKWRILSEINTTLWWNAIVWLKRYKLPISFLLQGSFHNRLILPAPTETF